jgi:hypothetical protein
LFTDSALEFFEQSSGHCAEGAENVLLYYRHGVSVDPGAIRSLMEDGFQVLRLFRANG